MIRYNYLTQIQPPAPFVYVTIRNPVNKSEIHDVPAQLDCAADRSVIPMSIVQALTLPQIGAINIGGVGGYAQAMSSYVVEVSIHILPSQTLEVVAIPGKAWVLLGRDVFNNHRLVLDGPQLALEIG